MVYLIQTDFICSYNYNKILIKKMTDGKSDLPKLEKLRDKLCPEGIVVAENHSKLGRIQKI